MIKTTQNLNVEKFVKIHQTYSVQIQCSYKQANINKLAAMIIRMYVS